MRIRENFTVFKRVMPSGRAVFYYQCYDEKGKRQVAKSTGKSLKTEAVAYCQKLYKSDILIPEQKKPTFAEFAAGWWNLDTCRYLQWRQLHDPITDNTLVGHQSNLKHHLLGYFAKFKLDEITPLVLEKWLVDMSKKESLKYAVKKPSSEKIDKKIKNKNENEINEKAKEIVVKPKKFLKPNTINLALTTLKIMLGEAVKQKLLKVNPCLEIKELREEKSERIILSQEEIKKIFPADWSKVWDNSIVFKAHALAACTGVRIGELCGLLGEFVFDDCIFIKGQFQRKKYVNYTKTKRNRTIPISSAIRIMLDDLLVKNGSGYVFSDDGGKTPINTTLLNRGFNRALKRIGISYEEKIKRNLSFHSWRHFLNTLLRMSDVADSKVQEVTGHLSLGQTNHYTHFDTRKFTEVRDVQTNLLSFFKPENENQIIQAEVVETEEKSFVEIEKIEEKTSA